MAEGFMWVAADGSEVVGTLGALARGPDLYLRGMAVLPAVRGCGVGRRLLAHAEAAAWLGGHSRIALSTTPFLTRAIELYERSGYVRCEEPPYDLNGTPLVSMVKVLP